MDDAKAPLTPTPSLPSQGHWSRKAFGSRSRTGCCRSATMARRDGEARANGLGRQCGQESGDHPQLGTINMPALQPTFQPTWTTERIERLKNWFEAGLSCRQIAADIGVSRNPRLGKISRLNLTPEKTIDLRRRAGKSAAKDPGKGPR